MEYKGTRIVIREIKELLPKGRQAARTMYGLSLYITAQLRIDKKGNESIVYQAATYFAKPSKHIAVYKIRVQY